MTHLGRGEVHQRGLQLLLPVHSQLPELVPLRLRLRQPALQRCVLPGRGLQLLLQVLVLALLTATKSDETCVSGATKTHVPQYLSCTACSCFSSDAICA
jgi:hypothetical protein